LFSRSSRASRRVSRQRLTSWANDERNENDERRTEVYVPLDVCRVVSTLIEGGLTSCSIKETLRVALDRVESVLEAEPGDPTDTECGTPVAEAGLAEAA